MGEQITLGRVLIVAPALVAAYAVTRPRIVAGERRPVALGSGVAVGAVAGLVGGAVFAVAIAFADWFGVDRIREVFVAVTEPLIDFLTFDKGVPAGLPILVGLCAAGGAIGGFARTAPAVDPQTRLGRRARRACSSVSCSGSSRSCSSSWGSRRTGCTAPRAG